MKNALSVWLLGGGLLLSAVASCNVPDPGYVDCVDPARCQGVTGPRPSGNGGGGGGGDDTSGGDDTAGGGDGGGGGGTSEGGAATPSQFAAPYDPAMGKIDAANSAKASHVTAAGAGAPQNPGRGTYCLDCHVAGGAAGGKPFLFGGTIFDTKGAPAPDVDIMVRDTTKKVIGIVKSDPDGNFWFDLPPGVTLVNAFVDVRNATMENYMSGLISTASGHGSCNKTNACHAGDGRLLAIKANTRK